jgi:hypothetical protein
MPLVEESSLALDKKRLINDLEDLKSPNTLNLSLASKAPLASKRGQTASLISQPLGDRHSRITKDLQSLFDTSLTSQPACHDEQPLPRQTPCLMHKKKLIEAFCVTCD